MSITMTVSGTGSSPMSRWRDGGWDRAAALWAERVGPVAREAIKLAAPVGRGPGAGTLRGSVKLRTEAGEGSVSVIAYSTVPYAGFVVDGTRPHKIVPRNARVLHWTDGSGDRFARSVNHPGTKPDPFPERGLAPFRPLLAEYFVTAIKESLEL